MSGGVDSSAAALILKERGFKVIGATYQVWERKSAGESCYGLEAAESARRSVDKIGTRHYVLNFREIFEAKVVAPFCEEYLG